MGYSVTVTCSWLWRRLFLLGFTSMDKWLVLPLLFGACNAAIWSSKNCNLEGLVGVVKGEVTDVLCVQGKIEACSQVQNKVYTSTREKEEACEDHVVCRWLNGTCTVNKDRRSNVCVPVHENGTRVEINPICTNITKGVCPTQFWVRRECCTGANAKYDGILETDDKQQYVCCNVPCEAMHAAVKASSATCRWQDHKNLEQCLPGARSFFGHGGAPGFQNTYDVELPPDAIQSIFGLQPSKSMSFGVLNPGFGYLGMPGPVGATAIEELGVGKSKEHHTEEITVDDMFELLVEALDQEKDVFEYNHQISSDPWFGKENFGGGVDGFNLVDPWKFIDQIYGSPFGLSQARLAYGQMYGMGQPGPGKFGAAQPGNLKKGAYGQPGGAYGQPGGAYGQPGGAYGHTGGAYGQPGPYGQSGQYGYEGRQHRSFNPIQSQYGQPQGHYSQHSQYQPQQTYHPGQPQQSQYPGQPQQSQYPGQPQQSQYQPQQSQYQPQQSQYSGQPQQSQYQPQQSQYSGQPQQSQYEPHERLYSGQDQQSQYQPNQGQYQQSQYSGHTMNNNYQSQQSEYQSDQNEASYDSHDQGQSSDQNYQESQQHPGQPQSGQYPGLPQQGAQYPEQTQPGQYLQPGQQQYLQGQKSSSASKKPQEESRQPQFRPITYESQFTEADKVVAPQGDNSDTASFYSMVNNEMGEIFTEYTKRR